jgi:hypothetical protein
MLATGIILLFLGGALVAQTRESNEGSIATAAVEEEQPSERSPEKASVLLPHLPRPNEAEERVLIPGVSNWAPSSTRQNVDPDEYKSLLGFYGPYYNVKEIDGRVRVLEQTVYVLPGESWRTNGLLRNQSSTTVRITAVTARLFGQDGTVLDTVAAVVPVDRVRPGEPVPFTAKSAVGRAEVAGIDWEIDYIPSETVVSRNLMFKFYHEGLTSDSSSYQILGSIHNTGATTVAGMHVVAAWLADDGTLIHVASPYLQQNLKERKDKLDLRESDSADFVYETKGNILVFLLQGADIMLWGASE